MDQKETVTEVEINARMQALGQQRDHAMNQVVLLQGAYAKLQAEFDAYKKEQEVKSE